jgi:hypothetical protein
VERAGAKVAAKQLAALPAHAADWGVLVVSPRELSRAERATAAHARRALAALPPSAALIASPGLRRLAGVHRGLPLLKEKENTRVRRIEERETKRRNNINKKKIEK